MPAKTETSNDSGNMELEDAEAIISRLVDQEVLSFGDADQDTSVTGRDEEGSDSAGSHTSVANKRANAQDVDEEMESVDGGEQAEAEEMQEPGSLLALDLDREGSPLFMTPSPKTKALLQSQAEVPELYDGLCGSDEETL